MVTVVAFRREPTRTPVVLNAMPEKKLTRKHTFTCTQKGGSNGWTNKRMELGHFQFNMILLSRCVEIVLSELNYVFSSAFFSSEKSSLYMMCWDFDYAKNEIVSTFLLSSLRHAICTLSLSHPLTDSILTLSSFILFPSSHHGVRACMSTSTCQKFSFNFLSFFPCCCSWLCSTAYTAHMQARAGLRVSIYKNYVKHEKKRTNSSRRIVVTRVVGWEWKYKLK